MKRMNEQGGVASVLTIVLLGILFVGAAAVAVWAYQGRQDYKNNTDQKVAAAVTTAKQQQSAADSAHFAEAEKQPLKTYKGPEAFGSITINYPKTWSSYVDESAQGGGNTVVDGYFAPGTVPSATASSSVFALRLQVLSESYATVVGDLSNLNSQNGPRPKITPYAAPHAPSVVGVRVDGPVADKKTGSMIILPLRDKTLKLWTEAPQYLDDFNNNILPNFTFSP